MLQDRKATSDAIRKARPRTRPNSWLKGADSIEPPIVRRQRLRADIPCWSGRPPTASNMPGCGVSTTQPREPPNDDYQDWPGYLQACLSGAWRRRSRATGVAPAGTAQRDGKVLWQAGPDPDRHRGLGHAVVLMPPQYIKPYVKRGKNDAIDAAAICEAMSRPGMRFVPIKSAEQQAGLMVLKVRDLLVKQRTMLINAIRGHAAEFGVTAAKGPVKVAELLQRADAEAAGVPALAREMLGVLSRPARRARRPAQGPRDPADGAAQGRPDQPMSGNPARHRSDRRGQLLAQGERSQSLPLGPAFCRRARHHPARAFDGRTTSAWPDQPTGR